MFDSFPKEISNKQLALNWLKYMIIGITVKIMLSTLYPITVVSDAEFASSFCKIPQVIEVFLAPVLETVIFMILPFVIFKKKGLVVGIIIWTLLHLLGRNIAVFGYICVMGFFYFRAVEQKKYKQIILLHGLINWVGLLSCLI